MIDLLTACQKRHKEVEAARIWRNEERERLARVEIIREERARVTELLQLRQALAAEQKRRAELEIRHRGLLFAHLKPPALHAVVTAAKRVKPKEECDICHRSFTSLAQHQVRMKHGEGWEVRRNETASATKRRLSDQRRRWPRATRKKKLDLADQLEAGHVTATEVKSDPLAARWICARAAGALAGQLEVEPVNETEVDDPFGRDGSGW